MARQSPHPHRAAGPDSAIGMARFFSPANLNRYRKLASGGIDVAERCRIFDVLAKELKAFRQEGRTSTHDQTHH